LLHRYHVVKSFFTWRKIMQSHLCSVEQVLLLLCYDINDPLRRSVVVLWVSFTWREIM
jgi:hypothetical protein